MAWRSDQSGGPQKRGGWSGAQRSRDQPRHRWQDTGSSTTSNKPRSRQRQGRWIVASLAAAGLLSTLVYLLLVSPERTPMVVVAATDYTLPLPLNPWAHEDHLAIAKLHKKNLTVYDVSASWSTEGSAKANIVPADVLSNQKGDHEPVIVYISAHGIVDGNNQPCLLPRGASISDSSSWIRVKDILEKLKPTEPDTPGRLLVLDCNRIRMNWGLGVIYNSFAERVQQVAESYSAENLAVIISAGPGQTNWAAADLSGSVFGRCLQLGLAGAADESDGDGDSDGEVSLRELAGYLAREVDAWSRFNRGEPQEPLLIPAEADDFRLTWVVSGGVLEKLKEEFQNQQAPKPTVSTEELGSVWKELSQLREHDLIRYDPIACRDLEHELLQLDELSHGGLAYADQAKREFDRLKDKISAALQRARSAQESRAVADHSGIVTPAKWARIPSAAFTLPVSEYFGARSTDETKQIQSLWTKLIESSDQQNTSTIIDHSGVKATAKDLAETQFLTALRDQQVASLWRRRPANLRNVLLQRSTAEELAVPRRGNGMPGDERAHYHARTMADKADAARRLAEDALFVGENNAPEHYTVLAERAGELYDQTRDVMEEAAAAFVAHDTALAETPYVAAWMCSPLATEYPERTSAVRQIVQLIRDTRNLGEVLNRHEYPNDQNGAPSSDLQAYRDPANEVQTSLKTLHESLQKESERLSKNDAQGTSGWRAIEALLQVPLIPGEIRSKLLGNRNKVSGDLYRQYFESDTPHPPDKEESDGGYLDSLAAWNPHPFVEIMRSAGLSGDIASIGDADAERIHWCESVGAQMRSRLAELPASSTANSAGEIPVEDAVLVERNHLCIAERQLRAAAAVDSGSAEATGDPITELRRFDLQQLLIWHSRRAMDDFWGGVANAAGEESFFARAASSYLQAAVGLGGRNPPLAVRDQIESKRQLLTERLEAKYNPLEITATARPLIEPAGTIAVSLSVAPNPRGGQYAQGMAALHIRGGKQRVADLAFVRSSADAKSFVEMPAGDGKPQQFEATIPEAAISSPLMEAVAFFRGRTDVSREIPVPAIKGVVIDYEPHRYENQQITLSGDRLQRSSIVFILDCSDSMEELSRVQDARQAGNMVQRMLLAKSALNTMLQEIADRNRNGEGIRVGVRFMGHRLAWSVRENPPPDWKSTLMRQTGYAREIPDNVPPSQDVEVVHHLGEFDFTVAGQVRRTLETVKPWGQTPLFYALSEALADFDKEPPNTEKSIIAITDGQDYQFDPPNADLRAPSYTSQDELLGAWERRKIPIHILAFDIPKNQIQVARTEYGRVAEVTNGSFAEASSGGDLLNRLRLRLEVDGYIVRDSQQQPVNLVRNREVVPARLNSAVVVPQDRRLPQEFTVHFRAVQPKRVLLEGGEAIELRVSQNGPSQDIVAEPYNRLVADWANLVRGVGGSQTNHIVRVHRPVRRDGSVRFPVSLQVDPSVSHFTQRPVETWIEVTPLTGSTAAGEPYVFYDRNLEPDTPVPVLMWNAQNWPAQADRARVKYWCKYDATDPVQTISWRDVRNSPADYGAFQAVRGMPGVELSIESNVESDGSYKIYIAEKHSSESTGIDSIRIQLDTGGEIAPIRVSHRFDSKNQIAMHSYYFSPEDGDRIDRSELCTIKIAAAKDVKENALQLPEGMPLEVEIDDSGELFSPRATANGQ
jgi:hypothetical protein